MTKDFKVTLVDENGILLLQSSYQDTIKEIQDADQDNSYVISIHDWLGIVIDELKQELTGRNDVVAEIEDYNNNPDHERDMEEDR